MSYEEELKGKKKKRPWWKVLTKYMFSHVGLTILVLVYCIIGGFLFKAIEEPAEQERKRLMDLEDSRLQQEIDKGLRNEWLIFKQDKVNETTFRAAAAEHLRSLLPQFVGAAQIYDKYDGGDDYTWDWDILKSFLFAVSIVTTIGYGHIRPRTSAGQLVCIVYALIGIPLMLMCLANLGDLMANGIRYLYARVFCRSCVGKKGRVSDISHPPPGKGRDPRGSRPGSAWSQSPSDAPMAGGGGGYDDGDDDLSKVTVPISLTLLLCIIYIGLGTVLFSVWEGWSFIWSAYFCFITVSTIGFGDLVPGTSLESDAHLKMAIVALYMLLGVAMLAMAISLVQEEMVAKFRWLGMKMGIVKPEEVEDMDDEVGDDDYDDESTDNERGGGEEQAGRGAEKKGKTYQPPQAPDNMPKKKRRKKKNKNRDESSNEDDSFEDSDLDDFNFRHEVDNDVANKKKRILAA